MSIKIIIICLLVVSCNQTQKIIIGPKIAGLVYNDDQKYVKTLGLGEHTISASDTVIIYDISEINMHGSLETRFASDTVAIVEYEINLNFKLDSLYKVQYYYGENYESRFLQPELYYGIRMALRETDITGFDPQVIRGSLESSPVANLFLIGDSKFVLKTVEGYYD